MAGKRKVILINPDQDFEGANTMTITNFPPLSLGTIASLTPPHWDVVIREEGFGEVDFEENCDLVGITAMSSQANRAYKIAEVYKQKGIPVVLGGIHATFCPEEAMKYVDAVVVGEAESVWHTVLEDFAAGKLQRIYKADSFVDLAGLPPASHHLFSKKHRWGIVQTTRGCPMNCEFCTVTAFNGRTYRKRPIEEVLDEIGLIGKRFLFFADDNLLGFGKSDEDRFFGLCEGIIRRGYKHKWVGQFTVSVSENDALLKIAKRSGCVLIFLGIESPSQDVLLSDMNKRINSKYIRDGQYINNIHKHNIPVMGAFIVGNDEDTSSTFSYLSQYINSLQIDLPVFSFLTPYPGTRLRKRLERDNRLCFVDYPGDWKYYTNFNRAMFDTKNMSRQQINSDMKKLAKEIYYLKAILKRTFRAFKLFKGNIINTISIFLGNMSHRNRHLKAPYFKRG